MLVMPAVTGTGLNHKCHSWWVFHSGFSPKAPKCWHRFLMLAQKCHKGAMKYFCTTPMWDRLAHGCGCWGTGRLHWLSMASAGVWREQRGGREVVFQVGGMKVVGIPRDCGQWARGRAGTRQYVRTQSASPGGAALAACVFPVLCHLQRQCRPKYRGTL